METRIKPYNPSSAGNGSGSMTERRIQFHKKNQLSTSRTIEVVPSATTATSFYPNIDLNIVQKINSTLDNNYYQERKGGRGHASLGGSGGYSIGNTICHKQSLSSSGSSKSQAATQSNKNITQFFFKKACEQPVGLGNSSITMLR